MHGKPDVFEDLHDPGPSGFSLYRGSWAGMVACPRRNHSMAKLIARRRVSCFFISWSRTVPVECEFDGKREFPLVEGFEDIGIRTRALHPHKGLFVGICGDKDHRDIHALPDLFCGLYPVHRGAFKHDIHQDQIRVDFSGPLQCLPGRRGRYGTLYPMPASTSRRFSATISSSSTISIFGIFSFMRSHPAYGSVMTNSVPPVAHQRDRPFELPHQHPDKVEPEGVRVLPVELFRDPLPVIPDDECYPGWFPPSAQL